MVQGSDQRPCARFNKLSMGGGRQQLRKLRALGSLILCTIVDNCPLNQ
jgi:hypothetical protein